MPLLVFLLIGAVWAAFLLPSFFESRRRAPTMATRNFQKSTELLASVAISDTQQIMARRRQAGRRRRILASLSAGAAVTLAVALLTGNMFWLVATILFDLFIGAYIMLLLMLRQRSLAVAATPRIGVAPEPRSADLRRESAQPASVRVVAG